MIAGANHSTLDGKEGWSGEECLGCHRANASITYASAETNRITQTANGKEIKYAKHNSSGIVVGNQSHAAYTPKCLDCHGSNGIYYNDTGVAKTAPSAKAFNTSDYGSDYSAHKELVEKSLNYNLSVGENEACIACHTNFSIESEYNYFWNIDLLH